ncbi:MAG: mercury methylation ferredoxin HgcB [Nitrospiraceae bacterium]|nr:mercury methylation ferredoxin HgcB [Nitrospiraceae bacterium]
MKYLSNAATLKLDAGKCAGCGMCIEVCPHGVFRLEGKRAVITDPDGCMECGACAVNCASGALAVDKGVGCAAAIINSILYGGEPSCDCTGKSNKDSCC